MAKAKAKAKETITLGCTQCGHANEPERVYCHNCGVKLDRSLLPTIEVHAESMEEMRKRLKRMTSPHANLLVVELKNALSVLVGSVVLAACIVMSRTPDGVPSTENLIADRQVDSTMIEAFALNKRVRVPFSQDEVNSFLRNKLRNKVKDGLFTFSRVYVIFEKDVIHVGLEQKFFEQPFHVTMDVAVSLQKGKLRHKILGGKMGKLAVHPEIMKGLAILYNPIWPPLKRDKEQLERMNSIFVEAGTVSLITNGQ